MKTAKHTVADDFAIAAENFRKITLAPEIVDRRNDRHPPPPDIDDRRTAVENRRAAPRMKRLKGGQIVLPTGETVKCIIRNLSETGANIEVYGAVSDDFTLIFDCDLSRYTCRVMWRKPPRIGVQFQLPDNLAPGS